MSGQTDTGTILKGIGGFYYVRDADGGVHECRACGRFRNDGVVPLPGDRVEFSPGGEGGGYIEALCPRKNLLTRPRVANVDMVAIVLSAQKPKADCLLCDKLIVEAKRLDILPLLVINKCDAGDADCIRALQNEYERACASLCVSAQTGEGLPALKERLSGRCTCFAGQSAAGKSSILNALFPWLGLKTGALSRKADRGRHTTRHAELLVMEDISGMVVDTPGFSFLESGDIRPEQLWHYYDDMRPHGAGCRFASCLHTREPGCGVKDAVGKGLIDQNRYQRYLLLLNELIDRRTKQYD